MARRSKSVNTGARRDSNNIANGTLSRSLLSDIEDRRTWHPDDDYRVASQFVIGHPRLIAMVVHKRPVVARSRPIYARRGLPVGLQLPVGVRFESPFRVALCVRRKIRRAILFAREKVGLGKRVRRGRRNWYSSVGC